MADHSKHSKSNKRGRWSARERAEGKREGIALTEQVKQLLLRGLVAFYAVDQTTMADAYRRTLANYFCAGGEVRYGCWVPILKPAEELPTFHQFRYVWARYAKDRYVCVRRRITPLEKVT